ncbi:hypothetical protein AK812_SmicGene15193 [Symbiodinium microadriaticum]|uniref:Uncharacterized protein n=1 Tax=Symbiodinium microadriaticum TaxID=2951 RepID=A0A1Q9E3N6_SYMMI|nr:hypothetical protein AK812_SmicGene15193 [Symbiodinium microadriaticum]
MRSSLTDPRAASYAGCLGGQVLPPDEVLALLKEVKNGKWVPPKGHSRYDAEGRHTGGAPIVACGGWADAGECLSPIPKEGGGYRVSQANGFVVLERLLPAEKLEVGEMSEEVDVDAVADEAMDGGLGGD